LERFRAERVCAGWELTTDEDSMAKDEHNKAAEHHENAAKAHRSAAEHHGKGDHAKGKEHALPNSTRRLQTSIAIRLIRRVSSRNSET
jgi:hypothetical protein